MLIQKQTDSRVQIIDQGVIICDLSADCTMRLAENNSGIIISDVTGVSYNLQLSTANETQILPAAAIAFSGSNVALWTLLVTDFFNELHQIVGGGGVVESNIIAVAGSYSVLTTNYIIYATANATVRLPTIGTNYGQVYRVFANGFDVLMSCDDPAGDRILGELTQNLSKFDMATFRCLYGNQWLVAD